MGDGEAAGEQSAGAWTHAGESGGAMTAKNEGIALVGQLIEDDDPQAAELDALRRENGRLKREVQDAKTEAARAREDANRALSRLRTQLSPLYRALQSVFGDLDAAGVEDRPTAGAPDVPGVSTPRTSAVWDAWKQRLPPAVGKVIDALLVHGELNQSQIKVAAQLGTSTVSDCIYKLNKAGLINKNGGRVSLKAL